VRRFGLSLASRGVPSCPLRTHHREGNDRRDGIRG
jgi:hypothetical protein